MATTKWGRKETIIWPPHSPIYTYGAVFMAVVLTGLFLYCRFTFGNSSLQRFYTPIYIRSSVAGAIGASRRDNYRMLMVGARGIAPRLATNADVTDGKTPEPGGKPIPLALSQLALQRGYTLLYLGPEQSYIDALLSAYLKSAVYGGDGSLRPLQAPAAFRSAVTGHPSPVLYRQGRTTTETTEVRTTSLRGPEMLTPKRAFRIRRREAEQRPFEYGVNKARRGNVGMFQGQHLLFSKLDHDHLYRRFSFGERFGRCACHAIAHFANVDASITNSGGLTNCVLFLFGQETNWCQFRSKVCGSRHHSPFLRVETAWRESSPRPS